LRAVAIGQNLGIRLNRDHNIRCIGIVDQNVKRPKILCMKQTAILNSDASQDQIVNIENCTCTNIWAALIPETFHLRMESGPIFPDPCATISQFPAPTATISDGHHLLNLCNCLCWVEPLGACPCTIQNGVASV